MSNAQRIVLPQTAVLTDDKGSYVLVVDSHDKVERRAVQGVGDGGERGDHRGRCRREGPRRRHRRRVSAGGRDGEAGRRAGERAAG